MLPTISKGRFPWITLTLLISFASVNAVLYTPALPDIATFLQISHAQGEGTVAWFLIGYALGQLLYGPLAERFGRKKALYMGIGLQILASLGCALTYYNNSYEWLIICRFLVAIGAGVGLKMTFTLVNEWYKPKEASQKIAYLMLAFAMTPGLAVGLGGLLNTYLGWPSCFLVGAVYGVALCVLVSRLPMQPSVINKKALQLRHLRRAYQQQFTNVSLLTGGLLMGAAGCFVYVFAAIAPFIAIDLLQMSSSEYGLANIIPSLGMIGGCLCSGQWVKKVDFKFLIKVGTAVSSLGVVLMAVLMLMGLSPWFSLFLPMMIIYFGLSFVMANASTLAMSLVVDKSHGSAVMNFINVGIATLSVLALGLCSIHAMLLPVVYAMICLVMGFTIVARL